jgi:hypothetical protein
MPCNPPKFAGAAANQQRYVGGAGMPYTIDDIQGVEWFEAVRRRAATHVGATIRRGLLALVGLLLVVACSSEPLDGPDTCSDVGVAREPFKRKCLPQSLDPITSTSDPNYGSVSCQMLAAWGQGSAECACNEPGFIPVTPEQRTFAASELSRTQSCEAACCSDLCFCQFLQHTGDALAACQSRPSASSTDDVPSGWCYVEPSLGLGTDEDVSACPLDQKRLIRFFPEGPRYTVTAVLACVGDP